MDNIIDIVDFEFDDMESTPGPRAPPFIILPSLKIMIIVMIIIMVIVMIILMLIGMKIIITNVMRRMLIMMMLPKMMPGTTNHHPSDD